MTISSEEAALADIGSGVGVEAGETEGAVADLLRGLLGERVFLAVAIDLEFSAVGSLENFADAADGAVGLVAIGFTSGP